MSGQSNQNIPEIIKLLESTSISVTEQTCTLVRDSLSSSSDPSLLNGLVDHYISSGNTVIRTLVVGVRSPQYKNLLMKLEEYLQKTTTRYAALNLMGYVVRKEPSWLHHIAQSRAFATVIKCLQLDNDIAVLTMAMYVMSTLLPKVPTQIVPSLSHLFGILIRLASWKIVRVVDASEINLSNFETALFSFFLCIYGMYPCSLIECLQNYYGKNRTSDAKFAGSPIMKYATTAGEEQVLMEKKRFDIFEAAVSPMLQKVRLNPHMILYSKDLEIMNEKWRKMESYDIVSDISQLFIAEGEQTYKGLSERSQVQSMESPYENVNQQVIPAQTTSSDEPVWSPSMVIGLSTPPSSRGMSPTREILDETKSNTDKSRLKPRPSTLTLSRGPLKTSNASTPCTPTMNEQQLFEFGKGDSDIEFVTSNQSSRRPTPRDMDTDSSGVTTAAKLSFHSTEIVTSKSENLISDFSPALQPIEDDQPMEAHASTVTVSDSLFIDTEKPTVQHLVKLACGDLPEGKKSAILDDELRLSIKAEKKATDIDWQHFGQETLTEKDSKRLLSGYLQLQCALLFEKHRRKQHATKARRLMRKIYESSALSERNQTLEALLSEKDYEISNLQTQVKSLRVEKIEADAKHRSAIEILKHELSRNSVLLKTVRDENEALKREKSQDKEQLSTLEENLKRLNADLIKAKLQLEHETRKKETNEELRAQVGNLQKELLLVEELNRKVQIMQQSNDHFRKTEAAEYDMMICSYQKGNNMLNEKYLAESRAKDIALVKAADVSRVLETKNSLLQEQKKYLENVKSLARSQIQAIETKYQSQKSIITQMEIQIMELYAKLTALEGSGDNSSRLIDKPLSCDSRHTICTSPQLSPPIQLSMTGQQSVATSELEASTISDQ